MKKQNEITSLNALVRTKRKSDCVIRTAISVIICGPGGALKKHSLWFNTHLNTNLIVGVLLSFDDCLRQYW